MAQHKPRIEDRTQVMIKARLRDAGVEREACILNLSSRGLAAAVDAPPARGTYVELTVGRHNLVGQVKWTSARRFGMAFRERVSVIGLISGDEGAIQLKARQAQSKNHKRKSRDAGNLARRAEFLIFVTAGFVATLIVYDFVAEALKSLDIVKLALSTGKISS